MTYDMENIIWSANSVREESERVTSTIDAYILNTWKFDPSADAQLKLSDAFCRNTIWCLEKGIPIIGEEDV